MSYMEKTMASIYSHLISTAQSNMVLTGATATTIAGMAWLLNDYYSWTSFGTGGTPATWAGYWKMTKLRIYFGLIKRTDPFNTAHLEAKEPSYLSEVPARKGGRPRIMPRILPQRQYPEPVVAETRARLQGLVRKLVVEHPELFELKPSHTEGGSTDGLYARRDLATLNPLATHPAADHEIAHVHPSDNSLHVFLSESDAKKVTEACWGQRFALSVVPGGWIMVYAARDEAELAVVEQIVLAAASWITGVRM